MNIAIFGDSFADSSINRDKFTSWTIYLSNDYNVKNFAKAGTSLWWSYEKFIKNYEKFDTIIFVATGYGRIATNKFMISGVLQAEFLLKEATAKKDELEKRIYQSAIDYFTFLQNEQLEIFLHEKIVEEIVKICSENNKKLILIPAFPYSGKFQSIFDINLSNITDRQFIVNFEGRDEIVKYTNYLDKMCNHLTPDNNKILAEKVKGIIEGTCKKITINDFKFEKFEDSGMYWFSNEESLKSFGKGI